MLKLLKHIVAAAARLLGRPPSAAVGEPAIVEAIQLTAHEAEASGPDTSSMTATSGTWPSRRRAVPAAITLARRIQKIAQRNRRLATAARPAAAPAPRLKLVKSHQRKPVPAAARKSGRHAVAHRRATDQSVRMQAALMTSRRRREAERPQALAALRTTATIYELRKVA